MRVYVKKVFSKNDVWEITKNMSFVSLRRPKNAQRLFAVFKTSHVLDIFHIKLLLNIFHEYVTFSKYYSFFKRTRKKCVDCTFFTKTNQANVPYYLNLNQSKTTNYQ